jgi:hypothetical protein
MTEKAGSILFLEKSLLDFIHAEVQKQEKGLQLVIEIEIDPEISVVIRYWRHQILENLTCN